MHSWIDYFGLGILEIFYAHPRLFHHRCWQLEETADSWKRQHATVQLSNKHSAGWELSSFLFWMQNLYCKTFGRINFSCTNNTTGNLTQHSPLTMFRTRFFCCFLYQLPFKDKCLYTKFTVTQGSRWIICSVCPQLLNTLGTFARPTAVTGWNHNGSSIHHRMELLFLTYPIMATAYPNCMIFLSGFVFEFWKAGGPIATQSERSSDRQVVLNCLCEGHFVFFLTNQQVCLSISIY